MQCMNKDCGNRLTGRQKTYCSDRCRKAQSRTGNSDKPNLDGKVGQVIIDACGVAHPINYEGRRRDYELLESWADGKGTEHQRRYGVLARHYRDKDFDLNRYTGMAYKATA